MDTEARILSVYEATVASLATVYGDEEPLHFGTLVSWENGGPDPLTGVSVFWNPSGHWHYVSLGMTERADKQTQRPEISGWGFEMTFRLAARDPNEVVPMWPLVLLNDFARYIYQSGRPLAHGHYVQRPGDPRGEYWGIVRDPTLPRCETVNGAFDWLTLVLLDAAQFERLKGDAYQELLAELASAVSTTSYA